MGRKALRLPILPPCWCLSYLFSVNIIFVVVFRCNYFICVPLLIFDFFELIILAFLLIFLCFFAFVLMIALRNTVYISNISIFLELILNYFTCNIKNWKCYIFIKIFHVLCFLLCLSHLHIVYTWSSVIIFSLYSHIKKFMHTHTIYGLYLSLVHVSLILLHLSVFLVFVIMEF